MAMNKKAIFLTLSAIIMSTFLLVFFTSGLEPRLNLEIEEDRIMYIDKFVEDLEEVQLERMIRTSAYNSLDTLYPSVADMDSEFTAAITPSLESRLIELASASEKLAISSSFMINNIQIRQDQETGPWKVNVTAQIDINITSDVAEWHISEYYTSIFDIYGLRDPIDGTLINSSDYVYNSTAPNFLERYNTKNPSICCGINKK